MKHFQKLVIAGIATLGAVSSALADDYNIKYSSNYLMPAYVHFTNNGQQYSIVSKINVPLYNIVWQNLCIG